MIFLYFFVFFYFIHEKYIIIKFFFIENVPINYPSLSIIIQKTRKIIQKLSNRSQKIPKNSEKSEKNPIFSRFFLWSHHPFCEKSCYQSACKNMKKMSQKKFGKKVVFIFANFFFKIHFGHFFMSNFKIKKKVLNFRFSPLFSSFLKLPFILDFLNFIS
jgi:hypothetical protein